MKLAQARREVYVGQGLPESVVDESLDIYIAGDLANDLSVALMRLVGRRLRAQHSCCMFLA